MKAVTAGALCVLAAAAVSGQQPPTFRASVDVVQVDVYVTDKDGKPVTGLMADDFEVFENDERRPIVAFAPVEIPVIAREPVWGDAESDVGTNTAPEGRTYLIILDPSVSMPMALRARQRLRVFMDKHFGENDLAAVVTGQGLVTDGQEFTNNRRLLMTAIDKFAGDNGGDKHLLDFRDRMEMLARMPGHRKIVLWITEGVPFDSYTLMDYRGGVLSTPAENAHAAMSAATRAGIRMFPINPAGLTTFASLGARMNFRGLAELTGGFAHDNSNDFEEAFERLVRETGTYYALGFEPQLQPKQGRYVRFDVKVKRPGLVVNARPGYLEQLDYVRKTAKPEPARTVAEAALANPAHVRGLSLRVNAAAFRGRGKAASVALTTHVDASVLDFEEKNGQFTTHLEIRHLATDARNVVYPEYKQTADLTLSSTDYERVRSGGLALVSDLELPEGRHQIRIALANGSKAGSVVYDLEVPDFRDRPLTMSGDALSSPSDEGVVTVQASARDGKPKQCRPPRCTANLRKNASLTRWMPQSAVAAILPWNAALPSPPTTVREFTAGDTVTAYLEVYDNNRRLESDPVYAVDATIALRGGNGRVMRTATQRRVSRDARRPSGGHGFAVSLPLEDVAPGPYVLDVEARAARLGVAPVQRRIPIRVANGGGVNSVTTTISRR